MFSERYTGSSLFLSKQKIDRVLTRRNEQPKTGKVKQLFWYGAPTHCQMTTVDEFSAFPTPQKATNWTIPNQKKLIRDTALRQTNQTNDIDGCVPGTTIYFQARKFTHKPDLYQSRDIAGATCPVLHPERKNKPLDPSLRTNDIPHCTPGIVALHTHRKVDPLQPSYALPSINQKLVKEIERNERGNQNSPPRETMKVNDIPGTRAKMTYLRSNPSNPLDYSDVPKTATQKRSKRDYTLNMTTEDIQHPPGEESKFNRNSNPLSPEYKVALAASSFSSTGGFGSLRSAVIGEIPGSKSSPAKALRKDMPLMSLRSDDIDGARPGDPYKKKSYL